MKNLTELGNSQIDRFYKKDVNVYSIEDLASKVIEDLEKMGRHEAVVKSDRKVGLVTIRDMLGAPQPHKTRLEEIWTVTDYLTPDEKVFDAVRMMSQIGVRAIPVIDNKGAVGCFTQIELCEAICRVEELPDIKVKELMRTPVSSLDINEKISVAKRLMLQEEISNIPVVEYGRLVGMITAESIVHFFMKRLEKTIKGEVAGERVDDYSGTVGGIMDHHPFTLDADDSWRKVACGLVELRKGACIIIDKERRVTGIITPKEIMRPLFGFAPEKEVPVYIAGLDAQDLLEKNLAEERIQRLLKRTQKLHPPIEEVRINIKTSKPFGVKTRYYMIAKATGAKEIYVAEAKGWDALTTFKILSERLEKELERRKHELKRISEND